MMSKLIEETEQTRGHVKSMFRALSFRINNRLTGALKQLPDADNLWCRKYSKHEPEDGFDYFILEDGVMKCFLDGEYEPISVDRVEQLLRTFGDINDLLNDMVRFEGDLLQALRVELDDLRVQKHELKLALARFEA